MKTFYVLWTYIANFSRLLKVEAKDADAALQCTVGWYMESDNPAFRDKATVYVFDSPPARIVYKGKTLDYESYRAASKDDR